MPRSTTLRAALALFLLASTARSETRREERLPDLPRERARWNAAFRLDAEGRLDGRRRQEALRHACRLPVDPAMDPAGKGDGPSALAPFPGVTWQPVGPRPIKPVAGWGRNLGDLSGRVTALAIHPSNPSFILAGAATGGIWKTTDGGASWRPVSDTAPALAMSAIVFSPSNPRVVYAATGEVDMAEHEFRPSTSLGTYLSAGILRSVDEGESWTRIDTNLPDNSVLSRVLVHPTNPQLVLAGVYLMQDVAANTSRVGGVYRSTDGGVTFARTVTHAVSDLAQDPNQPDVVYAAFGITNGCPSCADPSGVYRSADFGATFTPSLVPATPGATFASPTGNIKIGLTRTNPVAIYASVLDLRDEHAGGGIFRSTDAGASWSKRNVHPQMCGAQCWYDHFIQPALDDPETVYFGAVDLYKSTSGGSQWTNVSNVYGGGPAPIHPDQHVAAIHPSAPETILIGNDGGIYRSPDRFGTFLSLNATLSLAQFNGIALSSTDPNAAMGGTQDNGNLRFTGSFDWSDRTSGDGGFNLIRADNPNQRLAAHYNAALEYSADGGNFYRDASPTTMPSSELMAFYIPAVAAPAAPATVLIGTRRIWANTTFGAESTKWLARSPAAVVSSSMTALETVGDGTGVVWAGTFSGAVLFSTDGGATFSNKNAPLPRSVVTKIKAITPDGRSVYVTFGGFTGGVPSRHVFRTTDAGATWTNVSGDLPDVPVTAFAIDPGDPNGLFAGTDVGVFRSRDGGATWASFNAGLPHTTVTDLVFHPTTGDLWASTYGRGAFRITAGGSGAIVPAADFGFGPDVPAPGQSVAFTDRTLGVPASWAWDFGDGASSTLQNPLHAYAQAGTYTVSLVATNAAGSSTTTRSVVVVAGSAAPVTLQVPVVLDVFGVAPAHYTSDLVVVNRSAASTRLTVQYLPQPGTPGSNGPRPGRTLAAGREWRVPDVLAWLGANGYAFPAGSALVGTLRVTFEDVSDPSLVFAGSRTSTPNPNAAVGGSFGLFSAAPSTTAAAEGSAVITALREDSRYRSNLAIVDVPGGSGPASLSLQVVDGDTGLPAGAPIAYALQSGEWHQFSSILAGAGVSNGYVTIARTGGGSNRTLAYGVVNDGAASGGGTSDGSFVGTDAAAGLVPIVLSVGAAVGRYTSELVLTNPTASPVSATVSYTPAAALNGAGGPYAGSVAVGAGRQLRVADAVAWLRDTLGMPLPADGTNQGGTLLVSGVSAYVRTSNPNPDAAVGGTFGLAYPAVPAATRAKTEAWVYGLVQDSATRSNLAIADARVGSSASVPYLVEVYDADTGSATPVSTFVVSLTGGQWYQRGQVLSGTGVVHGYARVRPQSGTSDFVAYGVLNDGANPGERTSDGSYVPMSGVR